MARIHIDNDDDSLPDLADLLISPRKKIQPQAKDGSRPQPRSRPQLRLRQASSSRKVDGAEDGDGAGRRKEVEDERPMKPRQRVLKKVEGNARLGLGSGSSLVSKERDGLEADENKKTLPSRTARRVAKPRDQRVILSDHEDENEVDKHLREDSEYDSDDSLPLPSKLFRKPRLFGSELDKPAASLKLGKFLIPSLPSSAAASKESLIPKTQPVLTTTSRPTSSSDNDKSAFLI